MFDPLDPQLQRAARDVRRLYNYQIGQKGALGAVLIIVFVLAAAVFMLAEFAQMAAGIFAAAGGRP